MREMTELANNTVKMAILNMLNDLKEIMNTISIQMEHIKTSD